MFLGLANRNDVVMVAARRMYDEDDDPTPQTKGLQPPFAVIVASILARDREASQNRLATDKIESVDPEIDLALGFIVTDHTQIVDAHQMTVNPNRIYWS